jgi:carboxyl-terminal processing protease
LAQLALGIVIGGWLKCLAAIILVENSSKTKINKLIDFIDNEYVDNVNTDYSKYYG